MENFKNIISQETPVLIDFFNTTCDPCEMLTLVLKHAKNNLGKRVDVLQINLDENQDIAKQCQIHSTATMLLFQKGEIKWHS
ncbi:thioredoxin family protein [Patiriisocius hiemis]|uniref:Thioredoxin family protein n=1 Tax=Patiriisocius hiemis TaxID=3075604 RepID=A0ABU2YDC3_9FLAO|nr:thioredoxin family protein [Constantimarinum sp. W242]MDT0556189.1 thioredoxin family protein [Constantimarinum sp. W242]